MDEAKLTQLLGPESARLAIETMQRWQIVDETHVVIDRERLKRLRNVADLAAKLAAEQNGSLMASARLGYLRRAVNEIQPGDLDPIP